ATKYTRTYELAPGADIAQVRMRFTGARPREVNAAGDLILERAAGNLVEGKPEIYQERGGHKTPISGGYQIASEGAVGFWLGAYDRACPLIVVDSNEVT